MSGLICLETERFAGLGAWALFAKWKSVLLVEVPYSTNRLRALAVAFHQVSSLAALLAVEELHRQGGAILCPRSELFHRGEKVFVW